MIDRERKRAGMAWLCDTSFMLSGMPESKSIHYNSDSNTYRIPDAALELVLGYIEEASDRGAASLVCRRWYSVDRLARKEVSVGFSSAASPHLLTRRFTALQSIKLKGKPRAAMFKLVPEDWGGNAGPWIKEISLHCPCLHSLHLRRMIVPDNALLTLARERAHMLQVIKLDKCYDFSTNGLEAITRSCRCLRVLLLDESTIKEHNGKWLHELAIHNSTLEVVSFAATNLENFEIGDLETLVANCRSLTSLKVSEVELHRLSGVLSRAPLTLQELGGVLVGSSETENRQGKNNIKLPKSITSLVGFCYTGDDEGDNIVISLILPLASALRRLDLQLTFLSIEGHCQLLANCPNLEVLEVLNGIGDEGLEVVAKSCKKLQRLRVERGDKDVQTGFVTHRGLISVAKSCSELEYIAVYISDINNVALKAVGEGCPKLRDFRLVLLEDEENEVSDLPLDLGVMGLLKGCRELTRFGLYLRHGALTDVGMGYIGSLGLNLRWALFGLLGETDRGISLLADGCPNLEKLEMRDCVFSEAAIAKSALKMKSLKYLWVQGYNATGNGWDLLTMKRPFWNIEFIPEHFEPAMSGEEDEEIGWILQPTQFLAYRSLVGRRSDNPRTVICF